ncbi:MAG: zf-HC2 domain-containing protein [Acidobacteriota bacterium]
MRRPFECRECPQVGQLLDDFLNGELRVETIHAILTHLEGCSECRWERQWREEMRRTLGEAWNAQRVPIHLKRAIEGSLERRHGIQPLWLRWVADVFPVW